MLQQLGTTQLAKSTFLSSFIEKGIVSFNGFDFYSLCSSKYGAVIQSDNFHDLDNMNVVDYESWFWDGGWIIQKKFWLKTINLWVKLLMPSNADLVTLMDFMKERLQPIKGDLEVLINWQYRVYKATLVGVVFPNMNRGTNYLENVQVTFRITSGNWKIQEPSSYFFPNLTANTSYNIYVSGNKPTYPKFLFINKATWNSATQLKIRIRKLGDVSGNDVYITRTITNNETIEFDYENAIVKVDWVEPRFKNIMTKLYTGINIIDIEVIGSINTDFYVFYNPTFY